MNNRITNLWQRDPGRVAGIFYLVLFILAIFGSLKLVVVPGELSPAPLIFVAQIGIVADMFHIMFFLLLAWALYVVFSPRNKDLALLITLSITVSVAIQAVSTILNYAVISIKSSFQLASVFSLMQIEELARFFFDLSTVGTNIATFFWFLWVFTAGYLIYSTGIFHKYLGVILMAGGIGYLLMIFVFFLAPTLGMLSTLGSVLAGLAELSLMIWLLVKGAKRDMVQNIEE
jgi:hypothetical protein